MTTTPCPQCSQPNPSTNLFCGYCCARMPRLSEQPKAEGDKTDATWGELSQIYKDNQRLERENNALRVEVERLNLPNVAQAQDVYEIAKLRAKLAEAVKRIE